VIPKSVTKDRIAQNFDVFDFSLTAEDMEQIYSLDCGGRALLVEWYNEHKYYPFHIEY
jgi:aldehyde reductase